MDTFTAGSTPSLPTVSIIIPCYNYARFLDETLSSVQRQDFDDWECLIVDDGSTDNTREIGEAWVRRDARFRYLHQRNQGVNAARNNGLVNARGGWLRFLDADDLLASFGIEAQLAAQSEYSQTDIVHGHFVFMAHDGSSFYQWSHVRSRIRADDAFGDLLAAWEKGLMFPPHTVLYRRECFERWGNWDESLVTHDDWETLLRFAANGARFSYHNEVIAAYRKHHGSVVGDATTMRQGFLHTMLKLLESPQVERHYKPLIVFRFLEDCFKAIVQKLQKRRINLKAIYFDPNGQSVYRAWLLWTFVLCFPLLALLKLANMIHVRIRTAQGDFQRVDYPNFAFAERCSSPRSSPQSD